MRARRRRRDRNAIAIEVKSQMERCATTLTNAASTAFVIKNVKIRPARTSAGASMDTQVSIKHFARQLTVISINYFLFCFL